MRHIAAHLNAETILVGDSVELDISSFSPLPPYTVGTTSVNLSLNYINNNNSWLSNEDRTGLGIELLRV